MNCIDIICLTETKLDKNVHPSLYTLDNYHTPLARHRNRSGGGVMIFVRDNIAVKQLSNLEHSDIEWIWCLIKTGSSTIILNTVYLPPSLSADQHNYFLEKFSDSVMQAQAFCPDHLICLGDFNAGCNFLSPSYTNHSPISSFEIKLKDEIDSLDLKQLITEPTRYSPDYNVGNLRDLIIVSDPSHIIHSGVLSPFSKIDHLPIYMTLDITPPPPQIHQTLTWDYHHLDTDKLTRLLIDTDWDTILDNDINEATVQFTHTILNAAKESIPQHIKTIRNRDKPWVNSDLKRQIRKRERLFRKAKARNSDSDWNRWKLQRNLVTELNKKLKGHFIKMQTVKLLENKKNPQQYHQILKNMIGKNNFKNIPNLLQHDGMPVTDDLDKATLLNRHFADQTRLDVTDKIPPTITPDPSIPSFEEVRVTESEVLSALNNLNPNKSTGPDQIPTKLLKMIALLIAEPLTKLFNKSLSLGTFPTLWKQARVTPVYKKKGSSSDATNYRPISLLSCISKILEKLVFNKIYLHLTKYNLLPEKQSGYRPGHSTQIQLTYLTHQLYSSLDEKENFTAVYLDISKYFDKIWHRGLLEKCEKLCSIKGNLLKWIKSYLSNRSQVVRIGNTTSPPLKLHAGCPQGSVLGPLLALIYLSDLANLTENDSLYYADDTSLYSSHTPDCSDSRLSLQRDLDRIQKFGDDWAISFSGPKTIQQTFSTRRDSHKLPLTFDSVEIPSVQTHKHLGLTFSTDLHFHEHVNKIIQTVNSLLGPLYPVAKMLPRDILDQIYRTYIRPHFDNCDIVYDGNLTITDASRLDRLQTRIARLVTGALPRTSTDRLLDELGWERLKTRRTIHKLLFFYRITHNHPPLPDYFVRIRQPTRASITGLSLRNQDAQSLPRDRLILFRNSFLPSTTRLWNSLPLPITTCTSKHTFRRLVYDHFHIKRPPSFHSSGTKLGNIIHTHLRLNMSILNAHLFSINHPSAPSPACACGHKTENTRHIILHCPLYTTQREELFQFAFSLVPTIYTMTQQEKINLFLYCTNLSESSSLALTRRFQIFLLTCGRFGSICPQP